MQPRQAPAIEIDETAELPQPALLPSPHAEVPRAPYVLVIRGPGIGTVVKLTHDETIIGRASESNVVVLDSGISRQHACIRRTSTGWELVDLRSRNGTWLNGERIERTRLSQDDRVQLGSHTVLKFSLQDPLEERFQQRLYEASIRDGLTGAYNRRFFMEHLRTELAYASRHRKALSLVIFDVDDFKAINDTYGHLVGDQALRELVGLMSKQLRTEDALSRYGGDEFCVTLRDTGGDEAALVAERIRILVGEHRFGTEKSTFNVSVSVGVATLGRIESTAPEDLIKAADLALYRDKAS